MAIDTYVNIEELKKAGASDELAKVIVAQEKRLLEEEAVTKDFVRAEIQSLKGNIATWLISLFIAICAVMVGLFSLLYAVMH